MFALKINFHGQISYGPYRYQYYQIALKAALRHMENYPETKVTVVEIEDENEEE